MRSLHAACFDCKTERGSVAQSISFRHVREEPAIGTSSKKNGVASREIN